MLKQTKALDQWFTPDNDPRVLTYDKFRHIFTGERGDGGAASGENRRPVLRVV